MKLSIVKGATSVLARIWIQDSSSTTGAGLTGLSSASSGLVCYRARDDDGNAGGTSISLTSTGTLGTWASGWFKEKDSTNMPGWYEFGIPNAALATGSRSVDIELKGATNMAPLNIEIELTGWDNQDGVHGGMSALPNTACTTNASLLTSGTGTDQLSVTSGRIDIGKALGTAVTLDSNNVLNVSAKYLGGTLLTARDIGASVLLSNGTGSGQIILTSGAVTVGAYSAGQDSALRRGTAQAGGASTITLDSGASATDHLYEKLQVAILSGTGVGQSSRIITGYVGSTKVATVTPAWTTQPDSSSVFALFPAAADIETILGAASAGAAGYIGPDWSHVNAPTSTVGLTNTTISSGQTIASVSGNVGGSVGSISGVTFPTNFSAIAITSGGVVQADLQTIKTQAVTCSAGVTVGPFVGNSTAAIVVSASGHVSNVDTVTNLTNAATAGDLTATMKTSVQTAADAAITANTTIGAIETHAANIDTQVGTAGAGLTAITGKLPTALSANGNMKSDIEELAGSTGGASRLDRSARAIVTGTVGTGSTTTSIVTSALSPAAAVTDQFINRIVIFDKDTTTATLRGQAAVITTNTAGGVLTVAALSTAPVSGDTFTIT